MSGGTKVLRLNDPQLSADLERDADKGLMPAVMEMSTTPEPIERRQS